MGYNKIRGKTRGPGSRGEEPGEVSRTALHCPLGRAEVMRETLMEQSGWPHLHQVVLRAGGREPAPGIMGLERLIVDLELLLAVVPARPQGKPSQTASMLESPPPHQSLSKATHLPS